MKSSRIIKGRFPSNIILECSYGAGQGGKHEPYCVCGMLDEQSGESFSSGGRTRKLGTSGFGKLSGDKNINVKGNPGFGDKGGASRFFKVIK